LALVAVVGVVLLTIVGVVAGGWYFSDQLRDGALEPDHDPDRLALEVVALGEGQVTLRATKKASKDGDWTRDGVFGLDWEDGYGQVGAILGIEGRQVVREFSTLEGTLEAGELVRLDSFAYPGDPQRAHGIPFGEVTFASGLGEFPAWRVDGPGETWVIFVHGRGASRREALRMLPTVVDLGHPSLVITYRNDVEAPASADGFHRFGQTEWEDLEGAAEYAVRNGAERLVLVGYSMGGAIVANFLYESALAERVVGVILDAPLLDLGATAKARARDDGMPGFLVEIGKVVADLRFDVDWGELNYLRWTDELAVPILLFHGVEDDSVPVGTSDALAEARPDIVSYVRVAEAGHVRAWNRDRETYEASVRDFLEEETE
jgi:pimeloyl-ACP methyl ester carboxylesterase